MTKDVERLVIANGDAAAGDRVQMTRQARAEWSPPYAGVITCRDVLS